MVSGSPVLEFDRVARRYGAGDEPRYAVRSVSVSLAAGTSAALVGRSGSGKSTLLHLAAGIEVPTEGRVLLLGRDLAVESDAERTLLRRRSVGLVFQFFHLLPHLSVLENVLVPAWIAGERGAALERRAVALLERVGLGARARDPIEKLSGGEQQRVALCRAVVGDPPLLLADEPTGSLDDATGREVMDLLLERVRERGTALLFATHSAELAARADRVWRLVDGALAAPGAP